VTGSIPPDAAPARRHRGNVEGFSVGCIRGWVAAVPVDGRRLPVGLFCGDRLLCAGTADIFRDDLADAGIGDGRHAFALPLADADIHAVLLGGGDVSVRVLEGQHFEIGCLDLGDIVRDDPRSRYNLTRQAMGGALATLSRTLARLRQVVDAAPRPLLVAASDALFAPGRQTGDPASAPLSTAYLDFVLARAGRPAEADGDLAPALDWYISDYGAGRLGRRIPLSRDQIAWLNEPASTGGSAFELSRATLWKLPGNRHLSSGLPSDGEEWRDAVVYWWSVHHARNMHHEDCLVPERYAARLRAVRHARHTPDCPISVFMEHWYAENPLAHFLDLGKAADRHVLSAILLVRAIERPDFLRFIPPANIDALLGGQDAYWNSFFDLIAAADTGQGFERIDRSLYARLLAAVGYDLSTGAFSSVTPHGHRLEAARLPAPTNEQPFDVQLIGPLSKASGLGQAARLSAEILRHTPHSLNAVDFVLDDPARDSPDGPFAGSAFARARINLIHLNADSLPAAFAYAPDVFTGAHNIGYFFWELDSPAECDSLAFGLLDEIWVASEFGVSIYSGTSGLPVNRAGMCFEALPVPDRAASRAALERRFGFGADAFVFLVAFDSFSFIQRKNPLGTLDAFALAFPSDADVRLLIKTQNRSRVADPAQLAVWTEVDRRAAADPRIVLVDGTLPYDRFLQLKQAADCYVSLHRSEGWGFGMIEAMNLKVPVICTAYSGNMGFCGPETAWLVDFEMVPVPPGDYVYARAGHRWAEPDVDHAARQMRSVRSDAGLRQQRTAAAWRNVQDNFSAEAISARYRKRIGEILASRPDA
jgi:glycosyltransferase involved in cell wall biosynthesis